MKKEKLFYSEDDMVDEEMGDYKDDLKLDIQAKNIREQYKQYGMETRRLINMTALISVSAIIVMVLFLWLSFSVFPQHTFTFNFGEGTYNRVLLPSLQSIIMSITVLFLNLFIQGLFFYWIYTCKCRISGLVGKIKLLELKEMSLNNNIFNSQPILPFLLMLHTLIVLASLIASVSYVILVSM
jgi:hypothetical protein